jgi:hypothetical protein
VHDGLFHLVTGEAAGDENAVKKIVDIQFSFPRETGKEMNIEPVTAVHNGNGRTARHPVCRHSERKHKNRLVPVQKICFTGGSGEMLNECLIWC